jgi:cyclopropane-fatty-acyl-phospholipid synthase
MLQTVLNAIIRDGALAVRGPDGDVVTVGCVHADQAPVLVHIHDNATLRKIAANPSIAVGEAYMDGALTIERGTLYDFLAIGVRNVGRKPPRGLARLFSRRRNERLTSRRNVAHHYDLSADLYRLFLDADQQYSCAYFQRPDMSLEEAQIAKKRHIAAKLLLEPGQRVLDIGSGWGGLGITLAEDFGADVLGVTLSTEQLEVARKRARVRNVRTRFELQDYRDVAGPFDRIVSVGMFEHVGAAHFDTFFKTVQRLLKPDGVAVMHTIGRIGPPKPGNPWVEKYIFPGHYVPSLSQLAASVERAGLITTDVEILRTHYADTLRAWAERFAANRDKVRELYDERFCRMWEFYLAGGEASFRDGDLVVFQVQMAKQRLSVPQTRDYITDFDRAKPPRAVAAE